MAVSSTEADNYTIKNMIKEFKKGNVVIAKVDNSERKVDLYVMVVEDVSSYTSDFFQGVLIQTTGRDKHLYSLGDLRKDWSIDYFEVLSKKVK